MLVTCSDGTPGERGCSDTPRTSRVPYGMCACGGGGGTIASLLLLSSDLQHSTPLFQCVGEHSMLILLSFFICLRRLQLLDRRMLHNNNYSIYLLQLWISPGGPWPLVAGNCWLITVNSSYSSSSA